MRIDAQIAALRSDKALQRRANQAVEKSLREWRDDIDVGKIHSALERFGQGAELDQLPSLSMLMRSHEAAMRFVGKWTGLFVRSLSEQPLAQIPFRHSTSTGFSTLQIAASPGATLSLLAYEEHENMGPPSTITFTDCDQHEIVLSGAASGLSHRIDHTNRITTDEHCWRTGDRLPSCDQDRARQIVDVKGHLSILQLVRSPAEPKPVREIALADGELVHQSSGDKTASQTEMALAVLGAMGRSDAAPAIAEIASEGPDHLRWEALRHLLALQPLSGVSQLQTIAADTTDNLRIPAGALAKNLRASHPVLFERVIA